MCFSSNLLAQIPIIGNKEVYMALIIMFRNVFFFHEVMKADIILREACSLQLLHNKILINMLHLTRLEGAV
jgi:hypothetical protein